MQKTRDGEGAEPGCGGTQDGGGAIRASGRVPLLQRLLGKNNPHDEHGQLEKKNANRFAITTFSSC